MLLFSRSKSKTLRNEEGIKNKTEGLKKNRRWPIHTLLQNFRVPLAAEDDSE